MNRCFSILYPAPGEQQHQLSHILLIGEEFQGSKPGVKKIYWNKTKKSDLLTNYISFFQEKVSDGKTRYIWELFGNPTRDTVSAV